MAEQGHIGLVIKQLREERKLSKKRLAREAFISDAYLVQIEQGQRTPSEKVLRRLATAMQMPPAKLLEASGVYSEEVRSGATDWVRYVNDQRDKIGVRPLSPAEADQLYSETLDSWPEDNMPSTADLPFPMPGDEQWYRSGPEGWDELSRKDQRMVQQLINRLRYVESEG